MKRRVLLLVIDALTAPLFIAEMDNDCAKEQENCPHADESADRAVKKVFAMLGVNVDDPKSVTDFQQDLRFGGRLRRISDRVNITIITVVVATSVAGLLAMVWEKVAK